jgi:hypothetical protein
MMVRCLMTGGVLWVYSLHLRQTSNLQGPLIDSRQVIQRFYGLGSSLMEGLSQRMTRGKWIDGMSCLPLNRYSVHLFYP